MMVIFKRGGGGGGNFMMKKKNYGNLTSGMWNGKKTIQWR